MSTERNNKKTNVPKPATPIALLTGGPKVMYDDMGRILIESMFMGQVIQQVLDTTEPVVRQALLKIGWLAPGSNIEQNAYQSVAAMFGAGANPQEVVDFLMVKLGLSPDTPEVRASEIKKRIAVEAGADVQSLEEYIAHLEDAIQKAGYVVDEEETHGLPVAIRPMTEAEKDAREWATEQERGS